MADTFTKTTSQGWLSRLLESIKSVVVGAVLFLASFVVLFWNEGRAVQTAESLEEGAGIVQTVEATAPAATYDGKLVHLTGEATTADTVADPRFGMRLSAIKLIREVEMYQWEEEKKSETRKKVGGGEETVTTYHYKKTWASRPIDSSDFEEPVGHTNPGQFEFEDETFVAGNVTLGGFRLSEALVDKLTERVDVAPDPSALPSDLKAGMTVSGGAFYKGQNPTAPQVGDLRITFKAVKPAVVSVIAKQAGDTFEPYQTKAGDRLLQLRYGTMSAAAMFEAAQRENTMLTWLLRFAGFLMMFFGLMMVFRPISVFGDVIPLVGTLLGAGIGVFAGLVSVVLSLVTIAVAWIFFRPLIGVLLLVLAVGAFAALVTLAMKKRASRQEAATRGAA